MKPVITWIVLANARTARIVQNRGPGKGILATEETVLHALDPVEFSDDPGVFQNSADQSRSAADRNDPKRLAETVFARTILSHLTAALKHAKFNRLILTAGPHMLGNLRSEMPAELRDFVVAEIDRDLTQLTLDDLPTHLRNAIAI